MNVSRINDFRDMHVSITVDYRDEPIIGELIAGATSLAEDPFGGRAAAVVLLGDGRYALVESASILRIRRTDGQRVPVWGRDRHE